MEYQYDLIGQKSGLISVLARCRVLWHMKPHSLLVNFEMKSVIMSILSCDA